MTDETWVDAELEADLVRDAAPLTLDTDGMWEVVDAELDAVGPREKLVELPTRVRRMLAMLGLIGASSLLVVLQGLRADLDPSGWFSFVVAGWVLAFVGSVGALFALRSRAAPPVPAWPWIPAAWAFLLGWSAIGPWPGMTGVPPAMHLLCFTATSAMVLVSTLWIGVLEQGRRPVPWRLGLIAASSGSVAFVAQSLVCPGIDLVHLVVGHGGASVVGGLTTLGFALVGNRLRKAV
jgi:hypothetical protein